jgi:hypothetical protein
MPRYFLHLRDGRGEILDPEGADYNTHEDLESAVLKGARELIAADVLDGEVKLDQRIDAEDVVGQIIHSLHFSEAVTFTTAALGAC